MKTLGRDARNRLELVVGAIATGAAVLALATVIHPAPRQLAKTFPMTAALASERQSDGSGARTRVSPAFAYAVAHGDVVALEQLYRPGMPIDGMLAVAAEQGHEPTVRFLLAHGADVSENAQNERAPILLADAYPTIVALLLEHGAEEPTLTLAARAAAEHAVDRHLARGTNPAPPGEGPVADVLVSSNGSFPQKARIANKLLDAGASAVEKAYSGADALTGAVEACTAEDSLERCSGLVQRLIERGAHASGDAIAAALALDEPRREVLFHAVLAAPLEPGATSVALAKAWDPPRSLVKQLVAKGVDWGWREGEDDPALPLVAAVQRGDRAAVETLLAAGAPADRHFKSGASALGEAIDGLDRSATDYANVVERLVAHGADVNRRLPDGRSPLFAAAESGDVRTITFLLDHGARVNEHVLDDTPLDAAEQKGHVAAARVLHARGAQRSTHPGLRE